MNNPDNLPIRSDILSNAFEEFISKFQSAPYLDVQVRDILRLAFYTGALTIFSELLPVEKIKVLNAELLDFANNPMSEKIY